MLNQLNFLSLSLLLSGEKCKKQWTSLRNSFVHQKRLSECRSGSAATFRTPWQYMEMMQFLNDHVQQHRRTESSVGEIMAATSTPSPATHLQPEEEQR